MKLGASATSQGVTARWVTRGDISLLIRSGSRRFLGRASRCVAGCHTEAWSVFLNGGRYVDFTHRYQAKSAVEAAVSQALREAEQ